MLTIECTGRKNPASTGTYVGLDAVDVVGTLSTQFTRTEQDSSLLRYVGAWTTASRTFHSAGSYAYTKTTGDTVTVRFTGTAVDYITNKDTSYGIASVSLDGGAPVDVDLYSATPNVSQSRVWSAKGLANTEHTLTITCSGRKNAASSGYFTGLDAIDTDGSVLQAP